MDINRQTNLTNFPLSNYQFVLENLTKDTKSKELNDSICNHLLDAMLDASALNPYETVSNLKTANEYNLVRAKVFIKEAELCSLYNRELHEIASRDRRIRRDAVQLSNKDSKNINAIEKVLKVDYGHIIVVGNDEAKCLDALTISTELNGQHLFTNYGIKNVQQWREQMGRILRECLIDGADIVLGLEINQSQTSENINNAILEDITCICCYKTIPLRYLTRLLLSEFGEKHTLEGNRIWAVLETKLSAFKVALILKPSDFSWFVNSHKRLLVKLILIWWGDPSKQEQEQELYNELNNSHLFTEVQTSQIMRIVDDLVDAKLISIRVEKLRILKTIVKLAGKQKEEVKRTMVKYEKGMEKMKKRKSKLPGCRESC
uniref:Uncharacterized protein n=2 Tax=Caenorhabditis japonica TaxID=281687 RepID=A0A8R1E570_CAEJA